VTCPICRFEDCEELIIDLLICNACSHIFKKVAAENKHTKEKLHLYKTPVETIQEMSDGLENGDALEFIFPSMNFFGLDIQPSLFYKDQYNHYFNQRSIITLLERCGLNPVMQVNTWSGKICETRIIVMRHEE